MNAKALLKSPQKNPQFPTSIHPSQQNPTSDDQTSQNPTTPVQHDPGKHQPPIPHRTLPCPPINLFKLDNLHTSPNPQQKKNQQRENEMAPQESADDKFTACIARCLDATEVPPCERGDAACVCEKLDGEVNLAATLYNWCLVCSTGDFGYAREAVCGRFDGDQDDDDGDEEEEEEEEEDEEDGRTDNVVLVTSTETSKTTVTLGRTTTTPSPSPSPSTSTHQTPTPTPTPSLSEPSKTTPSTTTPTQTSTSPTSSPAESPSNLPIILSAALGTPLLLLLIFLLTLLLRAHRRRRRPQAQELPNSTQQSPTLPPFTQQQDTHGSDSKAAELDSATTQVSYASNIPECVCERMLMDCRPRTGRLWPSCTAAKLLRRFV